MSVSVSVCQTDPIEFVEDMCENMQLFPKEDLLTGDQLMFEFRPEVTVCVCMRVCISGFLFRQQDSSLSLN